MRLNTSEYNPVLSGYERCFNESCKKVFKVNEDNIEWHDFGTYSQKITYCPKCGRLKVLKTVDAEGLYVNTDTRYYQY